MVLCTIFIIISNNNNCQYESISPIYVNVRSLLASIYKKACILDLVDTDVMKFFSYTFSSEKKVVYTEPTYLWLIYVLGHSRYIRPSSEMGYIGIDLLVTPTHTS